MNLQGALKVHKLGALDAGFLYNETASSPQHIASVQILELLDDMSEAELFADLRSLLMSRIHLVPYFTNKLQFVPFNLDHPVWIRDPEFDIDNHLHTLEVPAPGGQPELESVIAALHETRLDRSRPLWDLWVLTGLEGGRVAYYNRAHHACLDGMAGQAMLETIMDPSTTPRTLEPAPADFFTRPDPHTAAQLVAGAVENFAKFQAKQPLAAVTAVDTAMRLVQRALDPTKGLGAVSQQAPATRFNRLIERQRSYAMGEIPLETAKTIARVTRTKINDVFLAICAGALRRYLERDGQLPESTMIAGCPVSLRRPGDNSPNNQVTMMMVSLATDESDPADRLQAIAGSTRTAKGFTQDVAASYDADIALPGLPGSLAAAVRTAELTRSPDLPGARPPCNVVVSNVPGPQQTQYSCGARMMTHYPVSIPTHSQGVNITVQSYDGALFFGITACARALPDTGSLRDDMMSAFEELKALYDMPSVSVALQQRAQPEEAEKAIKPRSKSSDRRPEAA